MDIRALENQSADPDLWNNRERAERVLLELNRKKGRLDPWVELKKLYRDLVELYDLALEEKDQSFERDIRRNLEQLERKYREARVIELFSEEHDRSSAFLTIHSGAGGTEACDWVSMLMRMYTRWIERHGFGSEMVDFQEAEGGLKSVTLLVKGDHAYGYLKGESGIHRLVRISPFDSNSRRHTSFASVFVIPEVEEDIEVEINPEDLRIDTYRAQGAGGQHVNKTDSAVRITHEPTEIVVLIIFMIYRVIFRVVVVGILKIACVSRNSAGFDFIPERFPDAPGIGEILVPVNSLEIILKTVGRHKWIFFFI